MSGGPDLIPASELPMLAKLMTTPKVRWELYRMDGMLRAALATGPIDAGCLSDYGVYHGMTHRDDYTPLTEGEARQVLAWMVGEWTPPHFTCCLARAATQHLDYLLALPARPGEPESEYVAASRLLASLSTAP